MYQLASLVFFILMPVSRKIHSFTARTLWGLLSIFGSLLLGCDKLEISPGADYAVKVISPLPLKSSQQLGSLPFRFSVSGCSDFKASIQILSEDGLDEHQLEKPIKDGDEYTSQIPVEWFSKHALCGQEIGSPVSNSLSYSINTLIPMNAQLAIICKDANRSASTPFKIEYSPAKFMFRNFDTGMVVDDLFSTADGAEIFTLSSRSGATKLTNWTFTNTSSSPVIDVFTSEVSIPSLPPSALLIKSKSNLYLLSKCLSDPAAPDENCYEHSLEDFPMIGDVFVGTPLKRLIIGDTFYSNLVLSKDEQGLEVSVALGYDEVTDEMYVDSVIAGEGSTSTTKFVPMKA